MGGTLRSARVFAVPIQTKVPSPNSWGELFFYKELSALPKPSFPALDCQDTSSWNVRTTEIINHRCVCLCACVCMLSGRREVGVSGCRGAGVSGCRGSGVSGNEKNMELSILGWLASRCARDANQRGMAECEKRVKTWRNEDLKQPHGRAAARRAYPPATVRSATPGKREYSRIVVLDTWVPGIECGM